MVEHGNCEFMEFQWKKQRLFFQGLEKSATNGSKVWKNRMSRFQPLENGSFKYAD